MKLRQKITIFVLLLTVGTVLGILGDADLGSSGPEYFWLGSVVQSLAGVFFGWTGVIAGTFFPVLLSISRKVAMAKFFLWVFADFTQSFVPYLAKKIFKFDPYVFNKKTILSFIFGCVIVANILGSQVACLAFLYTGEIPSQAGWWEISIRWFMSNVPSAIFFGLILLRFFAPALKECKITD